VLCCVVLCKWFWRTLKDYKVFTGTRVIEGDGIVVFVVSVHLLWGVVIPAVSGSTENEKFCKSRVVGVIFTANNNKGVGCSDGRAFIAITENTEGTRVVS